MNQPAKEDKQALSLYWRGRCCWLLEYKQKPLWEFVKLHLRKFSPFAGIGRLNLSLFVEALVHLALDFRLLIRKFFCFQVDAWISKHYRPTHSIAIKSKLWANQDLLFRGILVALERTRWPLVMLDLAKYPNLRLFPLRTGRAPFLPNRSNQHTLRRRL